LAENRQFEPTTPLFGAPLVVIASEFRRDLWQQKIRMPGLSYGVVDPAFSHFSTVLACDRRTDRQTDGRKET